MQVSFVLCIQYLSFTVLLSARTIFSLFALELGASAFEVGALAAVNQAPALLLSFVIGLMADRLGTCGLFAFGLLCGSAGLAIAWLAPGMPALYGAAVLCGIWSAFTVVLMQRAVGMLSKPETLTRNFSNQAMINSLAGVSGPLLAGYAIEHLGHARAIVVLLPFALLIGTLLLIGGGLLARASRGMPATSRGPAPENIGRGLTRLLLISGAVQLAMELFPFFLTLHGHAIGLSAAAIGFVISSAYVASLAARVILPPVVRRFGEERILSLALALSAFAFVLMPAFHSAATLVGVSLVQGLGMAFGGPLVLLLLYKGVPRERAGAAIGLRMTANAAIRVGSPPVFGASVVILGLPGVIFVTAALVGASGWAIGRRVWRAVT